jgi:NAD(P)-dependent dehydrogenase (short-subunit alcohol dehydrogenase family)
MGKLEGKVTIITGATKGLGYGIAKAFVKEGAKIATMARNKERLDAFVKDFTEAGYDVIGIQGDVTNRESVKKLVEETIKAFGTVDILVNNAAIQYFKALTDITDEDMEATLGPALYGSLYCMQEAFPYLKEHGGKIVNFGSLAGVYGMTENACYGMAKEGVLGLTRAAALEWAQYNIQVNAIAPLGATDMWFDFEKTGSKEEVDAFLAMIPAGRMGDPEKDVGRVVVFLASEDSNYITGRLLYVDGGQGATR